MPLAGCKGASNQSVSVSGSNRGESLPLRRKPPRSLIARGRRERAQPDFRRWQGQSYFPAQNVIFAPGSSQVVAHSNCLCRWRRLVCEDVGRLDCRAPSGMMIRFPRAKSLVPNPFGYNQLLMEGNREGRHDALVAWDRGIRPLRI
jgi:hypothetical protein